MEIRKKKSNPCFLFSDFQLRFYGVRLFYLCHNFKHSIDDVIKLVMYRVFKLWWDM